MLHSLVPVPNRPTTPLTAGALVPPPRPSSRPKLPTGKLTGINEIVSWHSAMFNSILSGVRVTFYHCTITFFRSGTAVQPAKDIERQPSSFGATRSSRELFIAVLKCITQRRKHPYCWWATTESFSSSALHQAIVSATQCAVFLFCRSSVSLLPLLTPLLAGAEHNLAPSFFSPEPELLSLSPFYLLSQSESTFPNSWAIPSSQHLNRC